jgi:hypothetical protein
MPGTLARAFWLRRSSSNRRWLAHEIVQQPVMLFRPKSANVLGMPDFIGWLQLFASWFKMGQLASNYLEKCTAQYCTLAKAQKQIVPCFRGDSGA